MKTISIPGAIYSRPAAPYDSEEQIVQGRRMMFFSGVVHDSFDEWSLVCPHALTFDLPKDWNPAPAEIAALKAKKTEVLAKFQAMVTEIDRQINERLAIENEVTT